MSNDSFTGDKKDGVSILHYAEVRFKNALVPCVPVGIETFHLTLTTIVWSILVILFSWLATYNRNWMWGTSLCIIAQYITDLLDGEIGRRRNTGLIKWGFYMDHFLDYVFLCSMLIGYSLLMPNNLKYMMFFVMAVFGAFMVNSFLQFAATNKFRIAYWGIGPTEIRLGLILVNCLIIYVNQAVWIMVLPLILAIACFGLFCTACMTQRQLWQMDMDIKAKQEGASIPNADDMQGMVIRHFFMSFIIAAMAFLILVMQIGRPFHKVIACIIFVVSWLPLILALMHKQWLHFKNIPIIRRYSSLVLAAVVLALSAWVVLTLKPSVSSVRAYSQEQIQKHVNEDALKVLQLSKDLQNLAGKDQCYEFLTCQRDLTRIREHYRSYHLIDFHTHPKLRTRAFLVVFSALTLQHNSVFAMALSHSAEDKRKALNQAYQKINIKANTFDELLRSLLMPNNLLKISAGSTYLKILKNQIHNAGDDTDLNLALEKIALTNSEAYYNKLQANPDIIIDVSKTLQLF